MRRSAGIIPVAQGTGLDGSTELSVMYPIGEVVKAEISPEAGSNMRLDKAGMKRDEIIQFQHCDIGEEVSAK